MKPAQEEGTKERRFLVFAQKIRSYAALSILALLLVPSTVLGGTKISGRVSGADGRPLPCGHAHILGFHGNIRWSPESIETVQLNSRGGFELEVEEPGMYRLVFTGASHKPMSVPLILEAGTPDVGVRARLAPLEYKDDISSVRIIGDWNGYNPEDADTMERRSDGTFAYSLKTEADTVGYKLLGITDDPGGVNGVHADFYGYDGSGGYVSVVRPKDGEATIVFDPALVPRSDGLDLPDLSVGWRTRWMEKLWKIDKIVDEAYERYSLWLEESEEKEAPGHDEKETENVLVQMMRGEKHLLVRGFAAIGLAQLLEMELSLDPDVLKDIINTLPPESKIWAVAPWSAPTLALTQNSDESMKMLKAFADKNEDKMVRALSLAELAMKAAREGDIEAAALYYDRLKKDHPSDRYLLEKADPFKKIMVGKQVPEFDLRLTGSDQSISKKSLLGKYYMLDFWATWCGPCRREMKSLHAAYKDFGGSRFSIISLSFDGEPEDVEKFRAKEWPMPWAHVFVKDGFDSELAKRFEVSGIPKPILVGPEGNILAVGEELRGTKLRKTLAHHLEARKESESK